MDTSFTPQFITVPVRMQNEKVKTLYNKEEWAIIQTRLNKVLIVYYFQTLMDVNNEPVVCTVVYMAGKDVSVALTVEEFEKILNKE